MMMMAAYRLFMASVTCGLSADDGGSAPETTRSFRVWD